MNGSLPVKNGKNTTLVKGGGSETRRKPVPASKPHSPAHSCDLGSSRFGDCEKENFLAEQVVQTPGRRPPVSLFGPSWKKKPSLFDHVCPRGRPSAGRSGRYLGGRVYQAVGLAPRGTARLKLTLHPLSDGAARLGERRCRKITGVRAAAAPVAAEPAALAISFHDRRKAAMTVRHYASGNRGMKSCCISANPPNS